MLRTSMKFPDVLLLFFLFSLSFSCFFFLRPKRLNRIFLFHRFLSSSAVVLLNRNDEPAAQRQIKVRKMDRCSCVGHCECSCLSDSRNEERCQPMSKKHYQAAGFQGPVLTKRVQPLTWPTDVVTIVCLVLFTLLLFFLLLGTDR